MTVRPRGTGLRIWASVLAVYALLLHAPTMAALGARPITVAAPAHHNHGGPSQDSVAKANSCCVVCAAGVCAIGPVGTSGIVLPSPALAALKARRAFARQPRPRRAASWSRARAPPASV